MGSWIISTYRDSPTDHPLSFADSEFSSKRRQTRKEKFLGRMGKLVPWRRLEVRKMTRQIAADFLDDTLRALPYRAHAVLTDNGVQFAKKAGTEAYKPHIFDVVCYRHGIDHRLTKPFHPWTNGQVERMNRTIKEATIRAFHYASLEQLQSHLAEYLWAYNSARPLRALKGKTPIGFILEQWQKEPERFYDDPSHFFAGPNT